MAIGKAAMIFMCFLIAAMAIVSIFAIAQKDQSTDAYYADANHTINKTMESTKQITTSVTGVTTPLVLVVAIMFFGAVIMMYKRR